MKHTPGPWRISRHCNTLVVAGERVTATTGGYQSNVDTERTSQENQSNAEFIVRACNAHYDLLAACKQAIPILVDLANRNDPAAGYAVLALEEAVEKAKVQ